MSDVKLGGYVKNISPLWAHAMKRAIGPGHTIPLDELYAQYGEKHELNAGDEFIMWLKEVKLRDSNKWKIFNADDTPYKSGVNAPKERPAEEVQAPVKDDTVSEKRSESRGDNVAPAVTKGLDVMDVVELSVRKAREVIPKITDIQLLRYAVKEANQRAQKDSLVRILRKRIQELEVSNRR